MRYIASVFAAAVFACSALHISEISGIEEGFGVEKRALQSVSILYRGARTRGKSCRHTAGISPESKPPRAFGETLGGFVPRGIRLRGARLGADKGTRRLRIGGALSFPRSVKSGVGRAFCAREIFCRAAKFSPDIKRFPALLHCAGHYYCAVIRFRSAGQCKPEIFQRGANLFSLFCLKYKTKVFL